MKILSLSKKDEVWELELPTRGSSVYKPVIETVAFSYKNKYQTTVVLAIPVSLSPIEFTDIFVLCLQLEHSQNIMFVDGFLWVCEFLLYLILCNKM